MDFLITYCEQWETPLRTSKHHYIERLAADGHRILYVEVPANPMSIFRRFNEFRSQVLPKLQGGPKEIASNIWVMTNFVPLPYHRAFGGIFDRLWVNHLNQLFLMPSLKSTLLKLRFNKPVLLTYYPFILPIINKLGVSRTVFHVVDEWQSMLGIPRSMAILTQQMLLHADVTVVPSIRLFNRYKQFAKRIELLQHGTDLSLFEPVARGMIKPDLRLLSLPGKKIGYYGALHKLNLNLVINVALRRPDWIFIFVGPIKGGQGMSMLNQFPRNVHFFEPLPREALPAFLAGVDSFWMPFTINELTQSMSPIKIFEVLSAGIPVVSSDLEECRAVAGEFGLFASNVEEHLAQLERAFSLRRPIDITRRVRAMKNYDWNNRYRDFLKLLI